MAGSLLTDYFLSDGIKATLEWHTSVASELEFEEFRNGVRHVRHDRIYVARCGNRKTTTPRAYFRRGSRSDLVFRWASP